MRTTTHDPLAAAVAKPDPWRAFCDGMDQVHRAQAECRGEALAIEQHCRATVAAALADQPNRSTDQRRML